jgi:hypothetical protein
MGRGKSYWLGVIGAEEEAEFSQAGTHVPSLCSGHAKSASRFLKLPLARQMHSQRSVRWGVIEEVAKSLAIQNMEWGRSMDGLEQDAPVTMKMWAGCPRLLEDTGGPHRPTGERQKM